MTTTLKAPRHMSKIRNKVEKFPVRLARVTGRDALGNVAGLELKKGFTNSDGKLVETSEVNAYAVESEPCEDGMAYRLTKDDGEVYSVRISEATGNSCSCPAGTYRGKCKHVSSLLSIAARDQQRPVMTCQQAKAAMESDDAAAWE